MKQALTLFALIAGLAACAPKTAQSPVTDTPEKIAEISHTELAATDSPQPSTPAQIQQTSIAVPSSDQIAYYYFVNPTEAVLPTGSVVIMPDTYILAPTLSETPHSPDVAANLRAALTSALRDSRNGWISDKLEIAGVTFGDGHADVVLNGEYFGVGDVTLIAASQQILLTIFANANVQTAIVTLNGDTIGNMGVSISINAKPADYIFTRVEVETYINEHTHALP